MSEIRKAVDFINGFENLSKDEQKEVVKKLMPKFCQIVMKDKTLIKEMIPECMEMMQGMDFPMKEMMSKMMGKGLKTIGDKNDYKREDNGSTKRGD